MKSHNCSRFKAGFYGIEDDECGEPATNIETVTFKKNIKINSVDVGE